MAAITPERVVAMQRLCEAVPADIQNTGGVVWTVDGHQVAEEEYEFEQVKLADCNDDLAEFAVAARTFVPDLLEAYAAATQWRPIETAPKDGTPFIAANQMDAFRAFYDTDDEVGVAEDSGKWFGALRFPPTHWASLPPAEGK